ncbi:MAG: DUF4339 domain-containing protein [bacterium]|nr:DUF4339 domain-containing protein [bacterium]
MFMKKVMLSASVLILLSACAQKEEISKKDEEIKKEVTEYHVIVSGKEYGPADIVTLKKWAGEGRVTSNTMIRQGNKPGWARDIQELKKYFNLKAKTIVDDEEGEEDILPETNVVTSYFPDDD